MVKSPRPPQRGRRAVPVTISAPVGGLNGRDSFEAMSRQDAFRLDNWFPAGTSADTRGGSLTFATGVPGAIEALEAYTGAAGAKMLAFGGGGIYDVTAGGAVGAALASGRASNRVTTCMFSNAGAQFLLIYSGNDQPQAYNGTTLTALTITGMTGSQNTLYAPHAFKGRVFLAQTGQLGFYYLAVGAIQGAAAFFDLQQQCARGGSMAAILSVSQDTGQGPQDYALFVTTEGEYVLYAGTDPSNAANWSLVGRYYGPPPIGFKGWFNFRGDAYFITEEGILSFEEIRKSGEVAVDKEYLSAKLGRHYTDAVKYQATHGWCGMIYPRGKQLLINVPLTGAETGGYVQFVMNTNSNSWCKFIGWNAVCWTLFNRRAYFGTTDGRVVLSDEGATDNGTEIRAVCRQAWTTLDDQNGMGEADKQFHFASFAMAADGSPAISAQVNVNYEDDQPEFTTAITPSVGAAWDVTDWDSDFWAGGAQTQNITVPVGKVGYTASVWVEAVSTAAIVQWYATRLTLEKLTGVLV